MITIRSEKDISPEMKEYISDLADCAGTMHDVGPDRLPCMGHGHLLSKCKVKTTPKVDNPEAIKFARSLGFHAMPTEGSSISVHPVQILECPCVNQSRDEKKRTWLADKLRANLVEPENKWVLAHDNFHKKRNPLFIRGGFGNDRNLALYVSQNFKGQIEAFHGVEFSDFLVKTVTDNKQWKPFGLYIVMDLDNVSKTDFTVRRISYLFRQAATGRPRIIFSSKKELAEIANDWSVDGHDKLEVYSALKEFYEVQV